MMRTYNDAPICIDCGDLLPYGWPLSRCRACREWAGVPDDGTPDDTGDNDDGMPSLPNMLWPEYAQQMAEREAKALLEKPEIAVARRHVRETLARWREEARTSGIPF